MTFSMGFTVPMAAGWILQLTAPSGFKLNRDDKGENYTRNEWRRCKNTLVTSGEDVKIHSKRVEKM